MDFLRRTLLQCGAIPFILASSCVCHAFGSRDVSGDFVSPPITLEAGRDTMPPAGNDAIDIPGSTGCPLPGIGECANDPNLVCTLAPGSGSDAASTRCSPAACNETLTGPDGITAADVPSGHITSARGGVSVTFNFRSSSHVRKVTISCSARDVANALNASVSTVKSGQLRRREPRWTRLQSKQRLWRRLLLQERR